MAKRRKTVKQTRAPRQSQTNRRFQRRWLELTGQQCLPRVGVHPALVSSLSSIRFVPTRLQRIIKMRWPLPEVVVFARKQEGKDCDQKAEIAGWYSCKHNGVCIGQVAVLKVLNAAASKLCSRDTSLSKPVSLWLRPQKGTWVLHLHSKPGGRLPHARY